MQASPPRWPTTLLLALALTGCGPEQPAAGPAASGPPAALPPTVEPPAAPATPDEPGSPSDDLAGADDPAQAAPPGARRPPGRWLPAREAAPAADATAAAIAELEAIGYVSGSRLAAGEGGAQVLDPARVQPGLNLVVSGHGPEALLLDLDGRVLHSWRRPCRDAFPELKDADAPRYQYFRRAHLLEDGGLLAIYEGSGLVRLDRDSNILWAWPGRAHHDLDVWPDGRIVVLTRRVRVVERLDPAQPVSEDFVAELSPDGQVLRSLSLLEALEATLGQAEALSLARAAIAPWRGDIFHANTAQLMTPERAAWWPLAQAGDVLVSLRNVDRIGLLDREARAFRWLRTGEWRAQHQPELLPSGRLLLFDNTGLGERSRVLELDPESGAITWSWSGSDADPLFSATCGSAQRLDNGNVLAVESDGGRAFEVTRDGQVVWRFDSPWRAGEQGELVATLFDCVRLPQGFPTDWLR